MNNNLIFLGLLFILATNGTISSTQALLLLALLTTTNQNNGCDPCGLPFGRSTTTTCNTTLN